MTENGEERRFDLHGRLIDFAVNIVNFISLFPNSPPGKHIGGQLLRSGTSPAANYAEAQAAESRKDFVHKMKVCLKELRETKVWLEIANRTKLLPQQNQCHFLVTESNELISIFVKSIATAKKNMDNSV